MTRYLLDTNIVSAMMRDPRGGATRRAREAGEPALCTSIFVAAELRFGAMKKGSTRLTFVVDEALRRLDIIPFEPPADRRYAELRASLESRGRPIGNTDMLIAAHTLALGYTLVTDNEREFSRVEGLKIENWLR